MFGVGVGGIYSIGEDGGGSEGVRGGPQGLVRVLAMVLAMVLAVPSLTLKTKEIGTPDPNQSPR